MAHVNLEAKSVEELVKLVAENQSLEDVKFELEIRTETLWDNEDEGDAWVNELNAFRNGHIAWTSWEVTSEQRKDYEKKKAKIFARKPAQHQAHRYWLQRKQSGYSYRSSTTIALGKTLGEQVVAVWTKVNRYGFASFDTHGLTLKGLLKRLGGSDELAAQIQKTNEEIAAKKREEARRIAAGEVARMLAAIERYFKEFPDLED